MDRCAKRWRAGGGRLTAKHVQVDHGAQGTSSARHEASAKQGGAQGGSGLLMFLVAALFAGSALISLTVLWFAIRGIQWLLHG